MFNTHQTAAALMLRGHGHAARSLTKGYAIDLENTELISDTELFSRLVNGRYNPLMDTFQQISDAYAIIRNFNS